MDYILRQGETISPMQSSSALAKKVEQAYQDMIDVKLLDTLERMSQPNYKSIPMSDDFHDTVLQRVLARMEK